MHLLMPALCGHAHPRQVCRILQSKSEMLLSCQVNGSWPTRSRRMTVRRGCAGATSSTLQKNYSGLCSRLSSIASCVAIAVGLTVLAAGWGVRLPFGFAS